MNAIDLMIGDWVCVQHNGNGPHHGRVTSLLPSGAVEVELLNGGTALCSSVRQIPLTSKILKKNGFKFNEEETNSTIQSVYRHYIKFFDFPLGTGFYIEYDTVENVAWITDHYWIKFRYVHEFQHVLRLCGIEKEIKL